MADTRIHGTTRQQVGKFFLEAEKPALRALPAMVFPVFEEARRTVHRDGHVEFKRACLLPCRPSMPAASSGCARRRACCASTTAAATRRCLDPRRSARSPWGQGIALFATDPAHLHSRKRHVIERGEDPLLDQCRLLGPFTGTWAEAMHQARGPQGLRVMLGLLQLAEKHPVAELEKAAGPATHHGAWRLRDLKRLLGQPANVVQLDFLDTHPLIRPLTKAVP